MSGLLVQTIGLMRRNKLYIPTTIGELYAGGYFGGFITVNTQRYAMLLSPTGGEASRTYKDTASASPASSLSEVDGYTATNDMITAGNHPIAIWANDKRTALLGGQNDWYVPAKNEMETIKSTLGYNTTFQGTNNGLASGQWFWSTTSNSSNQTQAWLVNNGGGSSAFVGKTFTGQYVRLIRRSLA